jgi:hypothetical protein
MAKKLGLSALLAVIMVTFSGCAAAASIAAMCEIAADSAGVREIDARGEHPPGAGEHQRGSRRRPLACVELRRQRLAELDVQRVGLAVRHSQHGDVPAVCQVDHVPGRS